MKCPQCATICSDLRDICPRCYADLRPFKRTAGIKITAPDASYEELRARLNPPASDGGSSLLDNFKKLLGVEAESEPSTTPPPVSTPALPPPVSNRTRERLLAETEVVLNEADRQLDKLMERLLPDQAQPTTRAITVSAPPPFTASPPSPGHPPASQQSDREQTSPSHHTRAPEEAPPSSAPFDLDLKLEPEEVPTPPPPPPAPESPWLHPVQQETTEIEALFSEALAEVAHASQLVEVELGAEQFRSAKHSEEVELLFDLAGDEIEDPSIIQRYSRQPLRSEERQMESSFLSQHLARLEQVLTSARPSLRRSGARADGESERIIVPITSTREIVPPSPAARLAAFAVDLVAITLLALLATFAYVMLAVPHLEVRLLDPARWQLLDLFIVLELFVPILAGMFLLYHLVTLLISHKTPGGDAYGFEVRGRDGARLRLDAALVRVLTMPMSILLLGWLPIVVRRRALHEVLSATSTTRLDEDPEAVA